jgi:hypothetical protein
VSVRAAILALGRFGITDRSMVKTLGKKWKHYQKEKSLDIYGHKAVAGKKSADEPSVDECLHPAGLDLS